MLRQLRLLGGGNAVAVQGTCDNRFEAVRAALEDILTSGEELGASLHVDLDGEPVVDLWGGFRDEARTTPRTDSPVVRTFTCPGGSLIVTDLDRRLTIAYMMNRMATGIIGSDRSEAYVRAVYAALDA